MGTVLPGLEIGAWALAGLAFLVGGTVKGVLGVGLPLFTVPVLAGMFEPATAIALMVVPILSSNVWQALQGGLIGEVLRRFWPAIPGRSSCPRSAPSSFRGSSRAPAPS